MIPGALQLSVKLMCVCGHVSEAEVFVMDDDTEATRGQAPIWCRKCNRHLLLQRVPTPRITIVADVRKPDDEMIEVHGPSDDPGEPKVH